MWNVCVRTPAARPVVAGDRFGRPRDVGVAQVDDEPATSGFGARLVHDGLRPNHLDVGRRSAVTGVNAYVAYVIWRALGRSHRGKSGEDRRHRAKTESKTPIHAATVKRGRTIGTSFQQ